MNRLIVDRSEEICPLFQRCSVTDIIGPRTRYVLTFNQSTANPGDDIRVQIPRLKDGTVLVPDSMALSFDIKTSGSKCWFKNNLAKQLQQQLEIQHSGEKVYHNAGESLLATYKDLWLTKSEGADMVEEGIASEALRRKISGCAQKDGKEAPTEAKNMLVVFGTRQRISLKKVLSDCGSNAPYRMRESLEYIITLPSANNLMVSDDDKVEPSYTLSNIELEYETITNHVLSDKSEGLYSAERLIPFEHVSLVRKSDWSKDKTQVNEAISVPRKSMKAIVMLFAKKNPTDSEEFIYPNVTRVEVSTNGAPGTIYAKGIPKTRLYKEARRLFGQDICHYRQDSHMTLAKFFANSHFALVVDMRTTSDPTVYGNGISVGTGQSAGILIEVQKKVTTDDLVCHIYAISDGALCISEGELSEVCV